MRTGIKTFGKKFYKVIRDLRAMGLFPLKPLTVFDVGANDGRSFLDLGRALPWLQIHAFEPTPYLVQKIREETKKVSNYHLVPKAVGSIPGKTSFNVAGKADWGCSSLLEFSDGLENTWPGRDDFVVTDRIEVEVITLSDYVLKNNIDSIDFLHIDTQGTDLDVLKSLESEIHIVKAGVVEVPQSMDVMLYKGQHSRDEMLEFLRLSGFEIWKETHQQNEINIFFRKRKY